MILQNLKKNATNFLGKEVKDAVISIPYNFNYIQREELMNAAYESGLNILDMVNSSTAAGIAYCFDKKPDKERNLLIFDLGGATLNISLMSWEDGLLDVRSINGSSYLYIGGEDFTKRLMEYCKGEFRRKTGIYIQKNAKAISRIYNACENAKITLSSSKQASIDLEYLMDGEDFNITITRDKFEDLCMDLFKKFIYSLENVLKDAKMSKSQIDDIILVGGSSRIPRIQLMIKEFFNGKELNKGLNPEEAIAYGLAIRAAIIPKAKDITIEKFVLLDVYPFSLGIETIGGVMNVLIPRNSSIPTKKQ